MLSDYIYHNALRSRVVITYFNAKMTGFVKIWDDTAVANLVQVRQAGPHSGQPKIAEQCNVVSALFVQ